MYSETSLYRYSIYRFHAIPVVFAVYLVTGIERFHCIEDSCSLHVRCICCERCTLLCGIVTTASKVLNEINSCCSV